MKPIAYKNDVDTKCAVFVNNVDSKKYLLFGAGYFVGDQPVDIGVYESFAATSGLQFTGEYYTLEANSEYLFDQVFCDYNSEQSQILLDNNMDPIELGMVLPS